MKKELNPKAGKAIFEYNGDDLEVSIQGMDMPTISYLALNGLHDILAKRKDPEKSYKDIRNGKLIKEKTYKPIVKALSDAFSIPHSEAQDMWDALSREQKMELRQDTRVKTALLSYEPDRIVDVASMLQPPQSPSRKSRDR